MKRTRGLSHDIALGGLPADVDPFAYISQLTTRRFTPRLPQSAIVLVAVFLVFHVLLAAFNLIILVLPYFGHARRTPWFSQKLYIYSRSGEKRLSGSLLNTGCWLDGLTLLFSFSFCVEKVYRTPLYLVNSGVLMSISQLLASVTTQAYILMQIKMNLSEHFSLRCQFFPAYVLALNPFFLGCIMVSIVFPYSVSGILMFGILSSRLGLMFIFNSYSYWSMTHCFLALWVIFLSTWTVEVRLIGWF
jgi:hypothetical protein